MAGGRLVEYMIQSLNGVAILPTAEYFTHCSTASSFHSPHCASPTSHFMSPFINCPFNLHLISVSMKCWVSVLSTDSLHCQVKFFHQLQLCDIQPKDPSVWCRNQFCFIEINICFEQGYAQVASLFSSNSTSLLNSSSYNPIHAHHVHRTFSKPLSKCL